MSSNRPQLDAQPGDSRGWSGAETGALVGLLAAELLFFVVFVAVVAWLVGVTFTVASTLWTRREKAIALTLLGTGFPVTFAVVYLGAYPGGHAAETVGVVLSIAYVVLQLVALGVLLRARRR